jgi:hypothetical protein
MFMRFTLIDANGAISFCGPGHGLKMLAAACSDGARSHREVFERLAPLDQTLVTSVRNGLSQFDEHCLGGDPSTISRWIEERGPLADAPFRVLDDTTRSASLQPDRLGLVIFNLEERRIVQVQNSYGALLRQDRGRIRKESKPISRFYRYELPSDWSIVP